MIIYMSELYPESFRPEEELKAIYLDGDHHPDLSFTASPDQISIVASTTENWEVSETTQSF